MAFDHLLHSITLIKKFGKKGYITSAPIQLKAISNAFAVTPVLNSGVHLDIINELNHKNLTVVETHPFS